MIPDFDFAGEPLPAGLSVIEASAGTGKTYAISHLVPRFLLDGTARNLGEILLVTFTNDAARELADRTRRVLEKLEAPPEAGEAATDPGLHRLRGRFGQEATRKVAGRALLDLDLLGVSTIHAFCQQVLQTEGSLCGLPSVPELIPDASDTADQTLRDLWESQIAGDPLLAAIASAMSWDLDEALRFVRLALPLESPEPAPATDPLPDILGRIQSAAAAWSLDAVQAFSDLLDSVTTWTKQDIGAAARCQLLASLRTNTSPTNAGFLTALLTLSGASSWINGTKDKKAKAAVAACAAVECAVGIESLMRGAWWAFLNESLGGVRQSIERSLAASRQITYDGLITTLRDALRGPSGSLLAGRLRERYRVALIDESQDTDDRQWEIFRTLFVGSQESSLSPNSNRLVLIGDPKQAIYAFRGADVNTYLAARSLAGDNVFSLRKTFRSPGPLVRATNALFASPDTFLKDGLTFFPATSGLDGDRRLAVGGIPDPARIECWIVPDDRGGEYSNKDRRTGRIAEAVASGIVRVLNAGSTIIRDDSNPRTVEPGDFAVLVNSAHQARVVAEALAARRVPAIRAGSDDIMASEEAAEILTILRALLEPRRAGLRHTALATRMFGIAAADIRALAESDDGDWLDRFILWHEEWHRRGFSAAMAAIDATIGATPRLAALPDGERRVTNLRQLIDLAEAASLTDGRDPSRIVRWLAQEIARAGASSLVEERQIQLESDENAVKVVTMHSSKGLQYPLVFCPFLWDAKPPSGFQKLAVPGRPPLIVDASAADEATKTSLIRSTLEDRVRLAYVAITRAQVKVWIVGGEVCGSRNRPAASALDWILRQDPSAGFGEWLESAATAGRGSRHAAAIDALIDSSGADILRLPPPEPTSEIRTAQAAGSTEPLEALDPPAIPPSWGLTSFSALTRENDPRADDASPALPAPSSPDHEPQRPPGKANPFLEAPGGPLVGTALHEWIEGWDFSHPDPAALSAHFSKYPPPVSSPSFHEQAGGMLSDLRAAVLPGMGCPVSTACPDAAASEWHFQLPIHASLGAERIAAAFAAHGEEDYAASLAALPADDLRGYLHGFLDRIAFHDGSWGIIDWKTNTLGPGPSDYGLDSLMRCARHSHYLLQTHLYLVALRRWLGPDARIAGAWLVFLRAVEAGTSHGILHVQPPPGLLDSLDALFAKPPASMPPSARP